MEVVLVEPRGGGANKRVSFKAVGFKRAGQNQCSLSLTPSPTLSLTLSVSQTHSLSPFTLCLSVLVSVSPKTPVKPENDGSLDLYSPCVARTHAARCPDVVMGRSREAGCWLAPPDSPSLGLAAGKPGYLLPPRAHHASCVCGPRPVSSTQRTIYTLSARQTHSTISRK